MKTLYLSIITALGIGSGIFLVYSHANMYPLNTPNHNSNSYTTFDAMGLQNTYQLGQTANFTLMVRGFGMSPCMTPAVKIYNNLTPDTPILDVKSAIMSCPVPTQPQNFEFYFPSKTSSFTAFLNQAGNYTLEISYGGRTILDSFSVLPNTSEQQQSVRTVTLSGDKGWLVCAAMEVPCPTNPTFQANQTGPDTYVVPFRVNDRPYTVTIKGSSYCVMPAIDPRHTCSEIFQGAFPAISGSVNVNDTGFAINYTINGGDHGIVNSSFNEKENSLSLELDEFYSGNLTVLIPPRLADLLEGQSRDSPVIVLEDGKEVKYGENQVNQYLNLMIPFQNPTYKIEIIATQLT